jgi:histone H2B
MPPKAAEKKPTTGGKAPAGKAPAAEKKEAGKKTAAAPSGEKKKRGKTRKETYSSYIYKGKSNHPRAYCRSGIASMNLIHQPSNSS